ADGTFSLNGGTPMGLSRPTAGRRWDFLPAGGTHRGTSSDCEDTVVTIGLISQDSPVKYRRNDFQK
ncbi:MAG: hypothetical protein J5743_06280, partial [Victivallales bacterium]|nr:hypothetical protein [Victivallales bacterium]